MPRLSRWMEPIPGLTMGQRAMRVAALGAAAAFSLVAPYTMLVIGTVFGAGYVASLRGQKRLLALKEARAGEDIGSFARAFDRRSETFDPHVVRAVWDAVQHAYGPLAPIPLRPTDRPKQDLLIDEDEFFEDGVLEAIAERAGRSLAGLQHNAFFGKVETLEDYVSMLSLQPRTVVA